MTAAPTPERLFVSLSLLDESTFRAVVLE